MKTLATKVTDEEVRRVRREAANRKLTVSAFLREALRNELAGRPDQTFGERFGHLFGTGTSRAAAESMKEGYED